MSSGYVMLGTPFPQTRLFLTMAHKGFDARFPNQNQTKHCWQNYVDYHKCVNAKGEDFKPCRQVSFLSRRSLWIQAFGRR